MLATPNVPQSGKRLLSLEWKKYWTLLQHLLQLEFGNHEVAENRGAELIRLIRFMFHVRKVSLKFMWDLNCSSVLKTLPYGQLFLCFT